MFKAKEQMITLCLPNGEKQEFSISHAERLLDMGKELNGGWVVDTTSPYFYDNENGIRLKSNKANTAKTK